FRPAPRLTAATAASLALLVALGVWQLGRAEDKRALIAEHAASAAREPFDDLHTPACRAPNVVLGATVRAPDLQVGEEVRFFGARADGAPGWRILRLTPAPDCDCAPASGRCVRDDLSVVVEVGFETLAGERSPAPRVLEIRPPPEPNVFTPQNDPEHGEFYRFDAAALARAFGVAPSQVEAGWWLAEHVP